jgi:pimeloyl-ACP methyl ester carboxylesterase
VQDGRLFVLIHGAWHDDACWEPLVAQLGSRGHECLTPVLPLGDPAATFVDYADAVLRCLAGRDRPVLVGHSMASAVAPLVAERFPVTLLVYLCPAMFGLPWPPDGPARERAGFRRPPVDAQGCTSWPRERAVNDLYGRLDPRLAGRLARRLRPQPQAPFSAPYPLRRPPDVPSALIYTRDDELFDDRWSRWIAAELLGVEAVELPGGHFPMLEHPGLLADLLETLVASAESALTAEATPSPPGTPARRPPRGSAAGPR